MTYLFSFLICFILCFGGQIIFDKTKLTPGHIIIIFVVFGVILSFLNIYDYLVKIAPGGASIMITNYGHLLYKNGEEGLDKSILSALMNMLKGGSSTLVMAVLMGVICSLIKHHE